MKSNHIVCPVCKKKMAVKSNPENHTKTLKCGNCGTSHTFPYLMPEGQIVV